MRKNVRHQMQKRMNSRIHVVILNLFHPRIIWRIEVHCRIRSLDSVQQIAAQLWWSAIVRLIFYITDRRWMANYSINQWFTYSMDTTNERNKWCFPSLSTRKNRLDKEYWYPIAREYETFFLTLLFFLLQVFTRYSVFSKMRKTICIEQPREKT